MTPDQQLAAGKMILDRDEETDAMLIEAAFCEQKAVTLKLKLLVQERQADLDLMKVLSAKMTDPETDFVEWRFAVLAYLGLTNRAIK